MADVLGLAPNAAAGWPGIALPLGSALPLLIKRILWIKLNECSDYISSYDFKQSVCKNFVPKWVFSTFMSNISMV